MKINPKNWREISLLTDSNNEMQHCENKISKTNVRSNGSLKNNPLSNVMTNAPPPHAVYT